MLKSNIRSCPNMIIPLLAMIVFIPIQELHQKTMRQKKVRMRA